jgi:acetyl esterase/lipase
MLDGGLLPVAASASVHVCRWLVMPRYLVLYPLLAAMMGISVGGSDAGFLPALQMPSGFVKVDFIGNGPAAAPSSTPADQSKYCAGVTFQRNYKYSDNDSDVLDVATAGSTEADPSDEPSHPVLLFVTGESFAEEGDNSDVIAALEDQALCFATHNGMIGVKVKYRMAPKFPWPAATQDVAAAISWAHENIDLFGGNPNEIIVIGYFAGAFHVADLLAHREFQDRDSVIAGAVLLSGIYDLKADAGAPERAYFGDDASKYGEQSAYPGILNIDTPILLAWSALDPPLLVAQGEELKKRLCSSPTQCPRTTVLKDGNGLLSAFGLDASSDGLTGPTLELIREIEARGLP